MGSTSFEKTFYEELVSSLCVRADFESWVKFTRPAFESLREFQDLKFSTLMGLAALNFGSTYARRTWPTHSNIYI